MTTPNFPAPYRHDHPPILNVNQIIETRMTFGQRLADRVVATVGSWWFIGIQSSILTLWAILNLTAWLRHWDPYPFILMNLVLSLQAAYTAPVIMMSQNRTAERDRTEAHNDYQVNQKTEEEVRVIIEHLNAQNLALAELHAMVEELKNR